MNIALVWLCKTPRGWRRFPVLTDVDDHGGVRYEKARLGWVNDVGVETHYPDGKFQLRSFVDGKQHFENATTQHPSYVIREWKTAKAKAAPAKGQPKTQGTLKGAAKLYIKHLEHHQRHEAAEHARLVLDEFQKVCTTTYVRGVTKACVEEYQAALRTGRMPNGKPLSDAKPRRGKRGVGNVTIGNKTHRLRSFFRFCKLPVDWMPPPPAVVKKRVKIYSQAQLEAIRTAADPYFRVVIDMALMLGLREQELMYAYWSDLDTERKLFTVQGKQSDGYKPANKEKGIEGKGWKFVPKDKEERTLSVPAVLLTRLAAHKETQAAGTRLILATSKWTVNTHMLRQLKRLAKDAGLNCGKCEGCKPRTRVEGKYKDVVQVGMECEQWKLHKFRAHCLTTMLRKGVDVKDVQEFAGHSSVETTMAYLAASDTEEMQVKVNEIWTD